MCFSANLKNCLSCLVLAGVALWFAGCSDTASTPSSTSTSSAPKVNGDGSTKGSSNVPGKTASKGTGSSSDESAKPSPDGDDEAAGSTTGREVPEATP
jgi:hypothetical protein